jgi:NADH-quinone oxidoreductase subunit E
MNVQNPNNSSGAVSPAQNQKANCLKDGCGKSDFNVPSALEAQIDEYISHYPQKRSASLMVLHLLQQHFKYISPEALEWAANKLNLQPINLLNS